MASIYVSKGMYFTVKPLVLLGCNKYIGYFC
jgi:hypothetical protein